MSQDILDTNQREGPEHLVRRAARPTGREAAGSGEADIAILSRMWVTLMSHERCRLVDRVSLVTSPGHSDGSAGWRRRNGPLGAGPSAIITTLCASRFGKMAVRRIWTRASWPFGR